MLQKPPERAAVAVIPIPEKARLLLWSLANADVMTVAWMLSAGEWLDRATLVTAVITLGGHHLVVLWLAAAGFAALALLIGLTVALTAIRRYTVPSSSRAPPHPPLSTKRTQ